MAGIRDLLRRQLTVLRLCATGPQRFSAICARLGAPPSTTVRLLRGLEGAGLLHQRSAGYVLAPEATRLALELLGHARPATTAESTVVDLSRQTGASAAFWIPDGDRLILAAKQEVPDGFHFLDRFAHRPMRDSAFGVVILAALPPAERSRRHSSAAMRRLIATVDDHGMFAGHLDHEPDFWRVAAVVRSASGVAGAVGISRHRRPTGLSAARDRRCVMAAALRLARELDG